MLQPVNLSTSNSTGITQRDTAFLAKLKAQGYSESAQYDYLNKARQKS